MTQFKSFSTKSIRIGSDADLINGSVIPGIFQTSTYVQPSPGKHKGYDYTRCTNPTRKNLESCLASLEDANYCLATASGLSAITCVINLLKAGANIICGNDVYGGTYRLLSTVFNDRYNVKWVDTTEVENVINAAKDFGKVDLIWVEATSNPLLRITDIIAVSQVAKKYGALLCVDSTFLTPYLQKPLDIGADIVVHSLTKYINGHSDVIAGSILTNSQDIYDRLYYIQKTLGPSLSPFDSWLILRGVKTLELRVERHQQNAIDVANFLNNHSKVEKVLYPALKNHKNANILQKQTTDNFKGGCMLSFYIKGGIEVSNKFLESLKIFQLAESLGGVESLACLPACMTHASVPVEVRNKNGITDNLIRLSVGIEGIDDLIEDLKNAFDAI